MAGAAADARTGAAHPGERRSRHGGIARDERAPARRVPHRLPLWEPCTASCYGVREAASSADAGDKGERAGGRYEKEDTTASQAVVTISTRGRGGVRGGRRRPEDR
ncbi:hypothetical protein SBADM41S_07450 [Streptomyces badius]